MQRTAQAVDYVKMETGCARAVRAMQAYDPYFDFDELEVEAREIFKEFYCNFLAGNLDYLAQVSAGPALAICKAEFKLRQQDNWSYMYQDLLDCGDCAFNAGEISELTKAPSFTYVVTTQQVECKVCTKTEEIKEGSEDNIMQIQWRFTLSRHDEPDIEATGHYWQVTELAKVGQLKQLV